MNYILFSKFKDNYSVRTICETECPIFLNSYLHSYVDKTKEELESDGITLISLPNVLPKYVIDGLKVRLKTKLIEYIEKVFKEYSAKYSVIDRLLFPTLFTQAKEFLSINNSANHDLIEVIADAKEISMKQAAKDMVTKVTAYDEMLYDLFCVQTTIDSQIDEATKIEEFFVVWNELNTYSMEQIMINIANYKSDFVPNKTAKTKKKDTCAVL
jgi:hypothetical protein